MAQKSLLLGAVTLLALAGSASAGASGVLKRHPHHRHVASNATEVLVARGRSVEIAFMPDLTGLTSSYATSLANAVRIAVAAHPAVRGFPIRINVIDTPCGDSGADVAAAATVVANLQNVAVLGPFCSTADTAALPLFESADIVTLSGSTTNPTLPPLGQDVFNSVAVSDGCCPYADLFDPWYATVGTLPSDLAWRQAYEGQFGSPPTAFADLYYDAAGLLIRTIQSASRLDGNELVINRAALARAVRSSTKYQGVTCTVGFDPATGFRANDPTALSRCAGP